jgi:hypothetical protein
VVNDAYRLALEAVLLPVSQHVTSGDGCWALVILGAAGRLVRAGAGLHDAIPFIVGYA